MSIEIGTAGEHLVCADLLLLGHRAFLSSAGYPYDVVVDVDHKLIRVAVKSTTRVVQRPEREGRRVCYSFAVTRPRSLRSGLSDARAYDPADIDIVAFCALDARRVAYCHMAECATTMHFDPIGTPLREMYRGKIPGRDRKSFDTFTFERALAVHCGERLPTQLRRARA